MHSQQNPLQTASASSTPTPAEPPPLPPVPSVSPHPTIGITPSASTQMNPNRYRITTSPVRRRAMKSGHVNASGVPSRSSVLRRNLRRRRAGSAFGAWGRSGCAVHLQGVGQLPSSLAAVRRQPRHLAGLDAVSPAIQLTSFAHLQRSPVHISPRSRYTTLRLQCVPLS